MINSDTYLYIIIALFTIPLLFFIIKTAVSYLKKRNEQPAEEEERAGYLFFEEGELINALSDAPKDSEGQVNVSSVIEGIIESKNSSGSKTGSKHTSDKNSYTETQDNTSDSIPANENGDSKKEGTISHNNSQDVFSEKTSAPPEPPQMQTLHDIVEEIKQTDSRVRAIEDTSSTKNYRDNSSPLSEKEEITRTEQDSTVKDKQEEPTVKKRVSTIKEVLNEFIAIKGLNAICLIEQDGSIIESVSTTYTDFDFLSDNASSLMNTADLLGKERHKGPLSMTITEFKKGFIIGSPVSEKRILIIDADQEATLGMIRYLIIKHKKALAAATAL